MVDNTCPARCASPSRALGGEEGGKRKPPAGAKAKRAGRLEVIISLVSSGVPPLLVSDITAPVHEEMSGCVAGDRLGSAGRSLLSATIDLITE